MSSNLEDNGEIKEYFVNFTPDVHLIQILGEQLIGSEKVGILELIKNSYDANATECHVWIEKVPGLPDAPLSGEEIADLPGPIITIIDNGIGMNEKRLYEGWLRPATRIKTSVKERLKKEMAEADSRGTREEYERLVSVLKFQNGGRLPLGEKGVGRFAAHRLGTFMVLQTKSADEPFEWLLKINWDEFVPKDDNPLDLSEIKLNLIRRFPQKDYGYSNSGTMLRIYGGRLGYKWTENTLREIGNAIALLCSPNKRRAVSGFQVVFHCPQLNEQFENPLSSVPAHLECIAIVDKYGRASIETRLNPPENLSVPINPNIEVEDVDLRRGYSKENKLYWCGNEDQNFRIPQCGAFILEIKFWYRNRDWLSIEYASFTKTLNEFGGVGVFRDGLSILPAQYASKNDWLNLSTRHIGKGERISYYQMSGSVDLLQEETLNLIDRTNREGLLDTQAFRDLAELVRAIIIHLEFRVQEVRDKYKLLTKGEGLSESQSIKQGDFISACFKVISEKYDFDNDLLGLRNIPGFEVDRKLINEMGEFPKKSLQEIRDLRFQSDALVEAAGYGIAIAISVHEIEKIASNLLADINELSKRLLTIDPGLHAQTQNITEITKALSIEAKRLAPLRVTRLDPWNRFKIRDSVSSAKGGFLLTWKDTNVSFTISSDNDFEVYGSYAACTQVFANLFDNATYWLRGRELNRRITVQIDPLKRQVVVADNGPGIAEKMRPHLFELFYSLKNPPSGLGLYICKYYIQQMKGRINETGSKYKIPGFEGAHFTLTFPEIDEASSGR